MSELSKRRRSLMAGEKQNDTSPQIAVYNRQLDSRGNPETASGYCITNKYKVPWQAGMSYRFKSGDAAVNKYICAWTGTETNFSTSWSRAVTGGQQIPVNYTFTSCWLALTLSMDYIDSCYLYEATTGLVIYAGRNTPYYGKSNINN